MSATSKVAGAVAAGYLLGRFKKLRLALLVGTAMASPKFRSAAVGLIEDRIPGGAVVGTLGKEVGTRLLDVGKTAATSVVAARIDGFTESLAHRSENLRKSTNGQTSKSRSEDAKDKEPAEAPDDEAYEDEENDVAEEPEDEYEQEDTDVAEEPEDERTQGAEDEESLDEEPEEEPVARSPRRRRSASPAGRRRG